MTIEELENNLPNGFHDSYLIDLRVDFCAATCCIELDVDRDDPGPNSFKRIKLKISGLAMFVMAPPLTQETLLFGESIWISGYATSPEMFADLERYRQRVPAESFFYSFFLHHYNCYIHLAAKEAAMESI
jgi:hypothetical protein